MKHQNLIVGHHFHSEGPDYQSMKKFPAVQLWLVVHGFLALMLLGLGSIKLSFVFFVAIMCCFVS